MRDGRLVARKLIGYFDFGRLYAAVELRHHQGRRPPAGALYDPQRLCRRLLRLHQPHAGDRDAGLRGHGRRFRHRIPHGPGRLRDRHGPDRVPAPQRLSRRRHEGASPRRQELRADRMLPGGRRKGPLADRRGVQAHVLARRRRRRARRDPGPYGDRQQRRGGGRPAAPACAPPPRPTGPVPTPSAAAGARLQPPNPLSRRAPTRIRPARCPASRPRNGAPASSRTPAERSRTARRAAPPAAGAARRPGAGAARAEPVLLLHVRPAEAVMSVSYVSSGSPSPLAGEGAR